MDTPEVILVKNPSIKDTRLVQLLKTLDEKEHKDLLLFVQSPYHNTVEAIVKLIALLLPFYPNFDQKRLTKPFIYKKIFNRSFKEDQLNQLFTKTCKVLEEFFAYYEFRQDELAKLKRKRDAFQKRNLIKDFAKASTKIEKQLKQDEVSNSQIYYERFLLNESLFYGESLGLEEKELALGKAIKNLDHWIIWEKLRLACLMRNETRVHKESFKTFLVPEILEQAKEVINQSQITSFYERNLEIPSFLEKNKVEDLIEQFKTIFDNLRAKEQYDFLISLINILSRKIREGEKKCSKLHLDLYRFGIDKKLFLKGNALPELTFINVAALAGVNAEFETGKTFIRDYNHLLQVNRKDAVHLAFSYIYFFEAKASFSQEEQSQIFYNALDHLRAIETTDTYYQYRVKMLQLRINYELSLKANGDIHWVFDFVRTFRRYIHRKTSLNDRKASTFIKFINITEQLLHARLDQESKKLARLEKIRKKLEKAESIFAKDWLFEKLIELENNRGKRT